MRFESRGVELAPPHRGGGGFSGRSPAALRRDLLGRHCERYIPLRVGRCKLDPSLKAPSFKSSIVKRIQGNNSAFNLKSCF